MVDNFAPHKVPRFMLVSHGNDASANAAIMGAVSRQRLPSIHLGCPFLLLCNGYLQ